MSRRGARGKIIAAESRRENETQPRLARCKKTPNDGKDACTPKTEAGEENTIAAKKKKKKKKSSFPDAWEKKARAGNDRKELFSSKPEAEDLR